MLTMLTMVTMMMVMLITMVRLMMMTMGTSKWESTPSRIEVEMTKILIFKWHSDLKNCIFTEDTNSVEIFYYQFIIQEKGHRWQFIAHCLI